MPRSPQIPKYGHHKGSGQARVIIQGKPIYLGTHGSPESREKYARLIAERFLPGAEYSTANPRRAEEFPDISINELLAKYWEFAQRYYTHDGKPASELRNMHEVLRWVRTIYSHQPARNFGPLALKAVSRHRRAHLLRSAACIGNRRRGNTGHGLLL